MKKIVSCYLKNGLWTGASIIKTGKEDGDEELGDSLGDQINQQPDVLNALRLEI